MKNIFLVLLFNCITCFYSHAQTGENLILGNWITVQNNLKVKVYKQNNNFRAKILWFKDNDDKSRPMEARTDEMNPDKYLRTRKWIGMDVLRDLRYNAKNKEWEHGKVYVAKNGKEWDSVAWISDNNLLKVKGYWLFKFLSQTLTFKRIS